MENLGSNWYNDRVTSEKREPPARRWPTWRRCVMRHSQSHSVFACTMLAAIAMMPPAYGDVIEAMFSTPREAMLGKSKYPSYSIKAKWNSKEIFVTLTNGQYKRLMGLSNLEGKKLVAVGYQGPTGKELIGLEIVD